MLAAEMNPLAKVGGLADVTGSLPAALGALGVRVHLFLPRYRRVRVKGPKLKVAPGVTVHFIGHKGYFQRRGIYGENGSSYSDNLERFSFFAREALERIREMKLAPNILHLHDWHVALAAVYLELKRENDPTLKPVRSILSIHNMAYQGSFPAREFPRLGFPRRLFCSKGIAHRGRVNFLKAGVLFADRLATVSPTYAREIQNCTQGAGLTRALQQRRGALEGILNGIDQGIWDPKRDQALRYRYDAARLGAKQKNKRALQKALGLPVEDKVLLIGMVTRLVSQKGLDLVVRVLPRFAKLNVQLVILGMGTRSIERVLSTQAKRHPGLKVRLAFDSGLACQIYAGADAFLMPSRYEPCGLGQMIAMRYGTVPIVRKTGGLSDTVTESSSEKAGGTGFCFSPYTAGALVKAVTRAVHAYQNPRRWNGIQRRGMHSNFSWDRSARRYLTLYKEVASQSIRRPAALRLLKGKDQPAAGHCGTLVVGLTGGVGTGKSSVAHNFKALGAAVLDADRLTHALMRPGTPVWRRIRAQFGTEALTASGRVDRRKLAAIVFRRPGDLKRLTRIIHPAVRREIQSRLRALKRRRVRVVVLDVPLLLEAGRAYRTDVTLVVTAPQAVVARRLRAARGWSAAQVRKRQALQWPLRKKVGCADFVVNNGGSRGSSRRQVIQIWKQLKGERFYGARKNG